MKKLLTTTAIGLLALSGIAHAKPFDPRSISADAKWVMHVDVDAIGQTKTWKLIEPKLLELPQFAKARADIERVGQVKLPDDLHDVTLYGPSFGEHEAVVVINATVNEERLKTLISLNETYSSEVIGGQTIHSWKDKDKDLVGGFSADHRIVIGQNAESVVKALDVLGGKVDAMEKGALVPPTDNAGILVYVAGDEIAKVARDKARSPIMQQLDKAWFTVDENERGMHLTSQITANTPKMALNVKNAIEGLKAVITFSDQNDPDASLIADTLLELNTKIEGNNVNIDWEVPTKTLNEIMDRATAKIEKPFKVTVP